MVKLDPGVGKEVVVTDESALAAIDIIQEDLFDEVGRPRSTHAAAAGLGRARRAGGEWKPGGEGGEVCMRA